MYLQKYLFFYIPDAAEISRSLKTLSSNELNQVVIVIFPS